MAEENHPDKLYNDADSYLKLGHLLRKKRDDDATVKVSRIMESHLPVEEKVRQIKEIDAGTQFELPPRKSDEAPSENDRLQRILESRNVVSETHAVRNRSKIKIVYKHNGFFPFWFKEFGRIKQFADKYQLIRYRDFPPKIRLSARAISYLTYSLQKDASEILQVLPDFFHEAWLYLEKWEYNLVVQFFQLVYKLSNLNFHQIDFDNRYILIHFLEIENDFLTCHYSTEYPHSIISNLRYVFERIPEHRKNVNIIVGIANRILLKHHKSPCLYNTIRAINMVEFRRYFQFSDLINQSFSRVISNFDFECTDMVRKRINTFIKETVNYLKQLLRELNGVEQLKNFVPNYDQNDILGQSFNLVRRFYEEGESKDVKYNADIQKVANFTMNIYTKYLSEFEDFLRHQVKMEKVGHVKVFDPDFFDPELSKLRTTLMKLNKHLFIVPHFNWELYQSIRRGKRASKTPELVTIQYFDEMSALVVDIANKLVQIYIHRKESVFVSENWKPIHQSDIVSHTVYIPFWDNVVYASGIINGRRFHQIIHRIITLSYLLGALYANPKVDYIMNRGTTLKNEIREKMVVLERIMDPLSYETISKMRQIQGEK